jgi:hypothetical protein
MPGYKGREYYAPEPTEDTNSLDKRFLFGLTKTQTGLIAPPALYFSLMLYVVLMSLPAVYKKRPGLLIPLAFGLYINGIHLYHHYALLKKM